jgi:hypothetical protein
MTAPPSVPTIPVYAESLVGALIDSARISVMAALALRPEPPAPLIITPGMPEEMADDVAASIDGCLDQAMQWLDLARAAAAVEVPPTSLHVVRSPARGEEPPPHQPAETPEEHRR